MLLPIGLFGQVKAIIAYDTPYYFSEDAGTYAAGEYKKGDTVEIQNFTFLHAIVIDVDKRKTFISESCFENTDALKAFKEQIEAKKSKAFYDAKANESLEYNKRVKTITAIWGRTIALKLANQVYEIGMTDDMIKVAIGAPKQINRTVNRYGSSEQWVYDDKYLYFENKKLTSFQTSK